MVRRFWTRRKLAHRRILFSFTRWAAVVALWLWAMSVLSLSEMVRQLAER